MQLKIEFTQKIYNTSLKWLFDMIVQNVSLTVTKTSIATIMQHEKRIDETWISNLN